MIKVKFSNIIIILKKCFYYNPTPDLIITSVFRTIFFSHFHYITSSLVRLISVISSHAGNADNVFD